MIGVSKGRVEKSHDGSKKYRWIEAKLESWVENKLAENEVKSIVELKFQNEFSLIPSTTSGNIKKKRGLINLITC